MENILYNLNDSANRFNIAIHATKNTKNTLSKIDKMCDTLINLMSIGCYKKSIKAEEVRLLNENKTFTKKDVILLRREYSIVLILVYIFTYRIFIMQ